MATTRKMWPGCLKTAWSKARERLGGGARSRARALRAGRAAEGSAGVFPLLFARRILATPNSSRPTSRKRLSLYKLAAALGPRLRQSRQRDGRSGLSASSKRRRSRRRSTFYENLRNEVKLHSGDAIDLKQYEPAMRHLIDTYIRAEESEKVSAFDDLSLVQLIVERGADAVNALPDGIRKNQKRGGGNHREQRPQADHRRAADQPEVLRKDVGTARRSDQTAARRGAELSGVSATDR